MKKILFILGISVVLFSCKTSNNLKCSIEKDGYFNCFAEDIKSQNNIVYTCEPSTVIFLNNYLIVGNDKDLPSYYSPIFSYYFSSDFECDSLTYYNTPNFFKAMKYEASTLTLDKKYIIFSGAFDYDISDPKKGKKHNTTIYFQSENFSKGGVLNVSNDTISNSINLKLLFQKALVSEKFPEGPKYIKIEGLTAIPGEKLIFGVREIGNKYDDFEYSIILLEVEYYFENNKMILKDNVKKIYEFIPDNNLNINLPIGISSIEYNKYDKKLYFITSYELSETSEKRGAYLWSISLKDLYDKKTPTLILDNNNLPINFTHKIEGLTIIDKKTLFIIGDDDRVTGENEENPKFKRKINQGYWAILKLKK